MLFEALRSERFYKWLIYKALQNALKNREIQSQGWVGSEIWLYLGGKMSLFETFSRLRQKWSNKVACFPQSAKTDLC